MNLQEQISRIQSMMGLLIEDEQKVYENKPIILIGSQGTGKSTTARALAEKLGIPLVETDMLMIDEKYENACKNEPGVEIDIKKVNGVINYSSNKEYEFCVMNKIFENYGNQKVVLDVGGSHAHWENEFSSKIMKLFNSTPNIFLFNVSDDEDETYEFVKKRREGRGEKISPKQEEKFKKIICKYMEYYNNLKDKVIDEYKNILNSSKNYKIEKLLQDEKEFKEQKRYVRQKQLLKDIDPLQFIPGYARICEKKYAPKILNENEIEVESPDGWVGVNYFIDKGMWDEYVLILEDNRTIDFCLIK